MRKSSSDDRLSMATSDLRRYDNDFSDATKGFGLPRDSRMGIESKNTKKTMGFGEVITEESSDDSVSQEKIRSSNYTTCSNIRNTITPSSIRKSIFSKPKLDSSTPNDASKLRSLMESRG